MTDYVIVKEIVGWFDNFFTIEKRKHPETKEEITVPIFVGSDGIHKVKPIPENKVDSLLNMIKEMDDDFLKRHPEAKNIVDKTKYHVVSYEDFMRGVRR